MRIWVESESLDEATAPGLFHHASQVGSWKTRRVIFREGKGHNFLPDVLTNVTL